MARTDIFDFVRFFVTIYFVDCANLEDAVNTIFEQSTSSGINPRMKRSACTDSQQHLINLVEKYIRHRADFKTEKLD